MPIDFSKVQIWPISNFLGLRQQRIKAAKTNEEAVPKFGQSSRLPPYPGGFYDILGRWTKMCIPITIIIYLTEMYYPMRQQIEDAKELDFSYNGWIAYSFYKCFIVDISIIMGWFWWVNYSAANTKDMQPLKFEYFFPKQPVTMWREVPYCFSTVFFGFLFEVMALRLYADGTIPKSRYYWDLWEFPLWTFLWYGLLPSWRDGHFWWIHRAMHPWHTEYFPDIGQFLFDYGHYLHHLSKNVITWSGVSMHPIEGSIYMSTSIFPLIFFHHPLLLWFVNIHLVLAAVLGHDGYDFPGAGDWIHYIHHQRFNVNYGSSNGPFDWFFGTFDIGADEWDKVLKDHEERQKLTPGRTPKRKHD